MRFALLLSLAFAGTALAQPVPQATPGSVSYPITTLRNVATFGASTVSPANVGRYAFATAIGGNVVADATTGLPLPDGRNLPVTVRSSIPKPQALAAIGRFLRKGLPFLGTGVALYDLAQELGYKAEVNGGAVQITQGDPRICTTAPCTRFRPDAISTWAPIENTLEGACRLYISSLDATTRTRSYESSSQAGTATYGHNCRMKSVLKTNGTVTYTNYPFVQFSTPPREAPFTPVPLETFEQALNDKTNWSPSSALGRSLVDAVKSGELIQAPPETVSGPASTPGPVSTTTDAVNNTTKTETTRFDHTYSGPNVTTTINTTTVTVDNSTGATISNTTTNSSPVMPESPQEEEEDNSFINSDLPTIPKLYDPEFPDGLQGVWNDRKAQLLDTSLFQLIPSLMPNMGDGGCPTWSIPSIYGGNLNASIPCSVWYFIRLVIIISALLLARRLIFGG